MKPATRRFVMYHLPPWLWGLGIFIGTSLPGEYLPEFVAFGPDKLYHIGLFLIFSILIFRSLHARERPFPIGKTIIVTVIIGVCYATFDELHQYFVPGRFPDPYDVVADLVGIGLGVSLMWTRRRVKRRGGMDVRSGRTSVS